MTRLNLKWSLKDIDDVQAMLRRGADAGEIAEAYLTTEDEVIALCFRNGFRVPKRSRKGEQQ